MVHSVIIHLISQVFFFLKFTKLLCIGICFYLTTFENIKKTSLANSRWPTRQQSIGFHYFHAWRPLYCVFYVSVVARFCFSDRQTYGRTDTTCENNDHLFSRGLVGQLTSCFKLYCEALYGTQCTTLEANLRPLRQTRDCHEPPLADVCV